jgi:hypothetical protein
MWVVRVNSGGCFSWKIQHSLLVERESVVATSIARERGVFLGF